jgi:hypothetical protein
MSVHPGRDRNCRSGQEFKILRSGYSLTLSGLPCPPPALNIQSLPSDQARLFWTNSAGGYLLESTPSLGAPGWTGVGTEPAVSGGNYNVTNATAGPGKFYRLHLP